MKIISALLGAVILILVLTTAGIAASIKAKTDNSKASRIINIDADRLPKRYDGDNSRVVEILTISYLQKGEFETNDAFAKRTEALENKVYVFSYKPRRFDELDGIWKKELYYDIEVNSVRIRLDSIKIVEKLWDDVRGSYIGQNAFGVNKSIRKGTRNRYNITLTDKPFDFDLQMEPAKAKITIDNIRILYWVKLRDVKGRKDTISPSIDNPFDGEYIECESLSTTIEMWIYDFNTGEIFKKVKFE
ncbi:MAG: hypothetical protein NTY86_09770 [Deltaproteobacteria bacterium]|nr:hypothetical protein [Deltaproteobacteria bacterium]